MDPLSTAPSAHIERAYRLLVGVGHALLRAPGEAELAREICRVSVEIAGYRLAWVGYRDSGERQEVRVVAHCGTDDGYLEQAHISWGEGERGGGPTGRALRSGEPQIAQNLATDPQFAPWRADALARGYASSAALPLGDPSAPWGVLNVYAPEPDAFDTHEVDLLRIVAKDLAYAIEAARGKHEVALLQSRLARIECLDAATRAAAMLAHDMNNHLSVAALCLDGVEQRSPESREERLRDARAALERAIVLNRQLLQLGRNESAPLDRFRPDEAIGSLAAALRRLVGAERELTFSLRAAALEIRMARPQFERVIMNLVANARDATAPGGAIQVATSPLRLDYPLDAKWLGGQPGDYLSLRVSDDGVGIDPDVMERLFDPFFSTKGERGTGLGLPSVHAAVRHVNGMIAVTSPPGSGATFEVLLPCAPASEREPAPP